MPNVFDLMMGSEPDAQESARALAEQIRKQRAYALAGALASPNAGKTMADMTAKAANEDAGLLEKAAQARMTKGEEAQNRAHQFRLAETMAKLNRPQFHVLPAGAPAAGMAWDPSTQSWKATGPALPQKPGGGGDKTPEARWIEFGNKFNAGIASARNPLGVSQNLINRAERIEAIPAGTPLPELDRRQMEEIGIGVASLMTGGNVVARQTFERLVPQSAVGHINKLKEWIFNNPTGLEQQEFAKKFLQIIAREKRVGLEQKKGTITQGALTYIDTIRHPEIKKKAKPWFKEAGFTDEEIANIMGEEPPAAPPPPGPSVPMGRTGGTPAVDLRKKYGL
jgi:hypothetical protein